MSIREIINGFEKDAAKYKEIAETLKIRLREANSEIERNKMEIARLRKENEEYKKLITDDADKTCIYDEGDSDIPQAQEVKKKSRRRKYVTQ